MITITKVVLDGVEYEAFDNGDARLYSTREAAEFASVCNRLDREENTKNHR